MFKFHWMWLLWVSSYVNRSNPKITYTNMNRNFRKISWYADRKLLLILLATKSISYMFPSLRTLQHTGIFSLSLSLSLPSSSHHLFMCNICVSVCRESKALYFIFSVYILFRIRLNLFHLIFPNCDEKYATMIL
jgi:hypothetical protein